MPHVVCLPGSISDRAARSFAIGLYGGLAERESVADAFKQGCAAISAEDSTERNRPLLLVREGSDAARSVPAAARSDPHSLLQQSRLTIENDDRVIDLELVDEHGRRCDGHAEAIRSLPYLTVVGPGGAGKTTWIRRLHRRIITADTR